MNKPLAPDGGQQPLWSDDDIVNAVYQLTYRVTDATALADIRAMMYKIRDEYEAERAAMQQPLETLQAAIATGQRWEPVGEVLCEQGWSVVSYSLGISIGWHDVIRATAVWPEEGKYAICRLTDAPTE